MFGPKQILPALLTILLHATVCTAQENLIYRYSYMHHTLLNPAVSGSEFFPVAGLTFHKQWTGFDSSPQTGLASASLRIGNFDYYNPRKLINTSSLRTRERIGLGMTVFSDRNGPAIQRGINLAYAYHLVLDRGRLAFGLSGSMEQHVLDERLFRTTQPDDPILDLSRDAYMQYNAGVGIYYYSDGPSAGFAVHHLIPLENKLRPGTDIVPDMILHGGYLFSSLGRPGLEIKFDLRYLDLEIFEADLHIRKYIQQYHWIAMTVRSFQALAVHMGLKVNLIHMVYTYEANLSNMIRYSLGTHALHLGINLGMRRTGGL
jgi:type IX secretion system PorP/SprF family membrane protein